MLDARQTVLKKYVHSVADAIGGARDAVDMKEYRKLWKEKAYTEIAKLVKDQFELPFKLIMGYVNSGGPKNAAAWVTGAWVLPEYGTEAFEKHSVKLYVRKSMLMERPLEAFMYTLAHEMAHFRLYAMRHLLCEVEGATDICAMLFGYAEVIAEGRTKTTYDNPVLARGLLGLLGQPIKSRTWTLGYLKADESRYVLQLIRDLR